MINPHFAGELTKGIIPFSAKKLNKKRLSNTRKIRCR
jgi:hypothetical protein